MDFLKDIYNKNIPRFGYVIEKDNGIVNVISEKGRGTTFIIKYFK